MNLPKEKHVHIFDFDNTLCKSNGMVKIFDTEFGHDFYFTATEYSDWREERYVERFPDRYRDVPVLDLGSIGAVLEVFM